MVTYIKKIKSTLITKIGRKNKKLSARGILFLTLECMKDYFYCITINNFNSSLKTRFVYIKNKTKLKVAAKSCHENELMRQIETSTEHIDR
jgi:hypothetical protein